MSMFFLVIIYMAFISLGLPDPLLGVAWPLMRSEYNVPFETAGLVSMLIAGGTIVSSFASGAVHKHLSTGKITLISCLLTASSLLGFSFSPSIIWILFLAIPLGLGAGSVDAALNSYVATHYKAHHMSWLHCFWGVGATLGPIIMSLFIAKQYSWKNGYFSISMIQFFLAILLFCTLPLWNRLAKEVHYNSDTPKNEKEKSSGGNSKKNTAKTKIIHIKGVKISLLSFLFYCGAEASMGLWGSSFLVNIKNMSAEAAALWVSLYYGGITVGRLITGFITFKVNNRILIRSGQVSALTGVLILLLPLPSIFSLLGFIMVGLGCAPIFPCMLHETPTRFGKENSQVIMGYQMALAYTGSTFLPAFLGLVAAHSTIGIFPLFVLLYIIFMLIGSEKLNVLMKKSKRSEMFLEEKPVKALIS
jgi:fucose permease